MLVNTATVASLGYQSVSSYHVQSKRLPAKTAPSVANQKGLHALQVLAVFSRPHMLHSISELHIHA